MPGAVVANGIVTKKTWYMHFPFSCRKYKNMHYWGWHFLVKKRDKNRNLKKMLFHVGKLLRAMIRIFLSFLKFTWATELEKLLNKSKEWNENPTKLLSRSFLGIRFDDHQSFLVSPTQSLCTTILAREFVYSTNKNTNTISYKIYKEIFKEKELSYLCFPCSWAQKYLLHWFSRFSFSDATDREWRNTIFIASCHFEQVDVDGIQCVWWGNEKGCVTDIFFES